MKSGGKANIFQVMSATIVVFLLILPFQNCGMSYNSQSDGLFLGDGFSDEDCMSDVVDCGAQPSFLEISIDLNNPSVFDNDLNGDGDSMDDGEVDFMVYGRCNDGGYSEHYLSWQLVGPTGTTLASNNVSQGCVNGEYQFPAPLNALTLNTRYTLTVRIVGIDESGEAYQNTQGGGSAQIDLSRQAL